LAVLETPRLSSPQPKGYRGRFAPSPTGPLHAGSVLAAVASFLDARAQRGVWLVRMEDLDPPRESVEAADAILRTLEALGLYWDERVVYQSQRHEAYAEALARLDAVGAVYTCRCSRQQLAASGTIYPGNCRTLALPRSGDAALRCRVPNAALGFMDRLQGQYAQQLDSEVGDFVIKRRDGLFAYQLAVVVDDEWQGITHVVRGMDLLDSTPRQIHLQRLLGYRTPDYAHVPLVVNAQGQKLGKQQYAEAVEATRPGPVLVQALRCLHQQPDPELTRAPVDAILQWATEHWRPEVLCGIKHLPEIEAPSSTAV
jgi:glutamyl-Q tRNA(Asp) synthetase